MIHNQKLSHGILALCTMGLCLLLLSSCESMGKSLPFNSIFGPDRTQPPGYGSAFTAVTSNVNCGTDTGWNSCREKIVGPLTGESCARQVLWLAQWGDMSLKAATQNGGITVVRAVEHSYTAYLSFVFEERCLIVHGN